MKIRTNFVTNSSSYSSAEIKIENPVLLEILKKYKELNTFVDSYNDLDRSDMIAVNAREIKEEHLYYNPCITESEVNEELEEFRDEPIALYYLEEEQAEVFYAPKNLEDVISYILKLIEDDGNVRFDNRDLYNEFKSELTARKDEINKNFVEVSWIAKNDSYGESEPDPGEETEWEFYYTNTDTE